MSTTAVRLPAAGTWDVDVAHSTLGFVARHLMVTKVRGHFRDFTASITVPAEGGLEAITGKAEIQASSITTNSERRDEHLRTADFFEVEKFPTLDFVSTAVKVIDESHAEVTGDFTIRGVTRPITLDVEFNGLSTNPWGKEVAFFTATGDINREDWGLTWNQALEGGGVLVGPKVHLEIEIQAIRRVEEQ